MMHRVPAGAAAVLVAPGRSRRHGLPRRRSAYRRPAVIGLLPGLAAALTGHIRSAWPSRRRPGNMTACAILFRAGLRAVARADRRHAPRRWCGRSIASSAIEAMRENAEWVAVYRQRHDPAAAMTAIATALALRRRWWPLARDERVCRRRPPSRPRRASSPDKQINLICGAAVGGGYDALARLMWRAISAGSLPAIPTVIVQNMPAAGSLAAANLIANTAPQGRPHDRAHPARHAAHAAHQSGRGALRSRQAQLDRQPFERGGVGVRLVHLRAQDRPGPVREGADRRRPCRGRSRADAAPVQRGAGNQIQDRDRLQRHHRHRSCDRARRGRRDRRLVVVEPQEAEAGLDSRQKDHAAAAKRGCRTIPSCRTCRTRSTFAKTDPDRKVIELFLTQKKVARPIIAPPGVPPERLAMLRTAVAALASDR